MDGSRGVSVSGVVCHLQCEISSVEVTGLGRCTGGARSRERALFLRCHVPAGGGRTIQIDSHNAAEATERHDGNGDPGGRSADVVSWRDVASLRCNGSPACVREVADRRSVVFEVRRRRRRRAIILGRAVGSSSELVGLAEVPWRDVVAVAAVERRVALAAPARGGDGGTVARDDAAPPVMSVRMSVRVSETAAPTRRRGVGSAAHREACGCEWSVGEEDVFGVVACVADDAFE